jgi:chromosome segregation ATPase
MPGRTTDLTKKAAALEDELDRFEKLVHEATRSSLDGQKDLERARRRLDGLAEAETRLNGKAGELAQLLGAMRGRQEASAGAIVEWAGAVQARIGQFIALRDRFATLATSASELQEALQAATGDPTQIGAVQRQVEELAATAAGLGEEARTAGFRDLQVEAESRRDQLLVSARKLADVRARRS